MASGAIKNLPEKLFATHDMAKLKTGMNLISQREDVSGYNGAQDPDLCA